MLRSRQYIQGYTADKLFLLLPPDPRWRPLTGDSIYLFLRQFSSAARMRGAEENKEKQIYGGRILVRLLLESEKRKKGEKRGKKEEKKRGSPRARPNYRSASVSRFHGSNALLLSSFYRWKTKVMTVLLSSILGRFWSFLLKMTIFVVSRPLKTCSWISKC